MAALENKPKDAEVAQIVANLSSLVDKLTGMGFSLAAAYLAQSIDAIARPDESAILNVVPTDPNVSRRMQ